jgi:hypothetical protein
MNRAIQIIWYSLGIILGLAGIAVLLLGSGFAALVLSFSPYRIQDFLFSATILVVAVSVGIALIYGANRAIDRANARLKD